MALWKPLTSQAIIQLFVRWAFVMAVSFDRVAGIYDATRWSGIPPEVMEKILRSMSDTFKGCRQILDVGVGTGRFAQYFIENGLVVVGIDVSLPMMIRAKEKGVGDLVRADAHDLPIRDLSFDGSTLIHVLHLVQDWARVVREVGRVTRSVVVSEAGDTEGFNPRQKYLELREELGYPLERLNDGEPGLRRIIRPKAVVSTGDYWTEIDGKEEIDTFEARRSSVMWDVPENVHRRIMKRLHEEYDGRKLRRHDSPEVVIWDPAQFRSLDSTTGQRWSPAITVVRERFLKPILATSSALRQSLLRKTYNRS